jgi:hypothetical protein
LENWWAFYLLGAFTLGIYLWNPLVRRKVNKLMIWLLKKFESLLRKTDDKSSRINDDDEDK